MKILFSSYAFRPSVGGIETVSEILAEEFVAAGHEVELITQTPGDVFSENRYRINRRPTLKRLIALIRWSDLLFQNNISLRSLLPALLLRKRVIVVHQTWIRNTRGEIDLRARLKRMLVGWSSGVLERRLSSRRVKTSAAGKPPLQRRGSVINVAISRAMAEDVGPNCIILPNPYRDDLFRIIPDTARTKNLIFVGRLVSDKGVDVLLRALTHLRRDGLTPDLTVVGAGPEFENLSALARELNLQDQVVFVGQKMSEQLVRLLNEHRVMIIPSRWAEPFGIVALEGIACGCAIIGSEAGGLKEAIGPCGMTFENGNEEALADALKRLLSDEALADSFSRAAAQHLERFKARNIAREYLQLMGELG